MTTEKTPVPRKLPAFLKTALSVAIVFHLLALGTMVLSAQSGPWSVRYLMGTPSPSLGPPFATSIGQYTTQYYLQPLNLANDYHFASSHTDFQTIYLEAAGQPKSKSAKYPDASANMWVRNRQRLLIAGTGNDGPFQGRQGQGIAPEGQEVPKITFFYHPFDAVQQKLSEMKDRDFKSRGRFLTELSYKLNKDELDLYQDEVLKMVEGPAGEYRLTDKMISALTNADLGAKAMNIYQLPEHLMPKAPPQMPTMTPSPGSMILIRSFARYLERQSGEPVELVRLHKNPIAPFMMLPSPMEPNKLFIDTPPYSLETVASNFGNGKPRAWAPK